MSNSWGQIFRITTFGESHGKAIGVVIDGCPPKVPFTIAQLQHELQRRRPGQSDLVSPRAEADVAVILSGIVDELTLGTPIAIVVDNTDIRRQDYQPFAKVFRPSHADWSSWQKYGIPPQSGGGRFSARETLARVAAGAVAKQVLQTCLGVEILAWVQRIEDIVAVVNSEQVEAAHIEASPVRCPDPQATAVMSARILEVKAMNDSVGGAIVGIARHVPAGLGEPVFDKLDADLAKAILSIPACKGIDFGAGFSGSFWRGSQHNDPLVNQQGRITTSSNHAGGINAGISNGSSIVLTAAFKPTSTIGQMQQTVNIDGEPVELTATGRHDPCVLPRAVPIVESMMALVLVDHFLRQRAIAGQWPV